MSRERFRDYEHLLRVAGLFAGGALAFLVARGFLVPAGFGTYGHFRAGALEDNRTRTLSFAGSADCESCHSDVAEARKGDKHEGVHCEACHGPNRAHAQADDPGTSKPEKPDSRVCRVCHLANVAKPRSFPQIDVATHGKGRACLLCHKAHQPSDLSEAKP